MLRESLGDPALALLSWGGAACVLTPLPLQLLLGPLTSSG